jgi:very-short-patch-repair endonuclease
MADDHKFSEILLRQAGVFTRSQARECGLHPREVGQAIRDGKWIRVAGRGLARQGLEIGIEQLAWAAALSVQHGTLWGPCAVKLWRADAPIALPTVADLEVPYSHRAQFRIRFRIKDAAKGERVELKGVRVQTWDAALADALIVLDKAAADSLFAWAVTRELASAETLAAEAARRAHFPGVSRLRRYADMWRQGAASTAEVLFHSVMERHGISGWRPNARLLLPGGVCAVVDVLFEEAKLAVEVDGWIAHSSREAFFKDRKRNNALTKAGYRVVHVTWDDLAEDPDECADLVKTLLANRD